MVLWGCAWTPCGWFWWGCAWTMCGWFCGGVPGSPSRMMSSGEGDGLVPGGTGSLPDAWGACLSFVTWYQKLGPLG